MDKSEVGVKRKSRLAVFEHVVEKKKDPKSKKFKTNIFDLDDSSPSESELLAGDETDAGKQKRTISVRLTDEVLNLKCEWNFCGINFKSWSKLNLHLLEHARAQSGTLRCCWKNCTDTSVSIELFKQHASYHGYLAKLMNIGQNVINRNDLPQCTQKASCTIPIEPSGYVCEWEFCTFNFFNIYEFYKHMDSHVKNNPRVANEKLKETINCCWKGCGLSYSNQYKLADHLRTHTKEKPLACPTCCTLFSNKTKLCDHRKRQLPTDLQSYQCSQCLKIFANERLLRDHIRSHINHYKCTMCDMTCSKSSNLAKHVRFKHIGYKPYKCNKCDKSFVENHNLALHLKTHGEKSMKCDQCNFSCRSKVGLDKHYGRKHGRQLAVYQCHCCKKEFKRGGYLTKHLMKAHNYHWPSGHTRFCYRKAKDGFHRLQTVRYESLEVTQEMIRSESMQTNSAKSERTYKLKYDNQKNSNYLLSISDSDGKTVTESEDQNKILITINDVDEDGKIVRSEVVESTAIIGEMVKDSVVLRQTGLPNLEASDTDEDEVVAGTKLPKLDYSSELENRSAHDLVVTENDSNLIAVIDDAGSMSEDMAANEKTAPKEDQTENKLLNYEMFKTGRSK